MPSIFPRGRDFARLSTSSPGERVSLGYTYRMLFGRDNQNNALGARCGRLRLHVLASGSKGNCSVVQDAATGECVVIDCGITKRAFFERCAECGVDVGRVGAILVSHEHTDHTKGVGVVTRGLAKIGVQPVVFASRAVHAASRELREVQDAVDLRHFSAGDAVDVGCMQVCPFHTIHDAAESFGFRVDVLGGAAYRGACVGDTCDRDAVCCDSIGFMTDTGVVTGEAFDALHGCRILAIESNHDSDMLAHGPYPAHLKERIASECGHLSNLQSAQLLEDLLDDSLECVVGMHVSQNNNTYRLPVEAFGAVLARHDHPATALVGYQDRIVSV